MTEAKSQVTPGQWRGFAASASYFLASSVRHIPQATDKIFNRPGPLLCCQEIGGGAMFPYAIAEGEQRILLQGRPRQKTRQIPRQDIAAPSLRQEGIAG